MKKQNPGQIKAGVSEPNPTYAFEELATEGNSITGASNAVAPQKHFISQFSPQRTSAADLEAIFVQRETLLSKTVAKLASSLMGGSKHYFMFIGPRGMGKTHLLSMIFHRLSVLPELVSHMRVAWLNEDETSTSFLKLLMRIYRNLASRYPEEFPNADLQDIFGMAPDAARTSLGALLLSKLGSHQILLLIENCGSLFAHMPEAELRNWRGYVQTYPVFAIAASAQALFTGISKRSETFFGFFDTQTLAPLNPNEARELLIKIAAWNGQTDLADYLRSPHGLARLMAIHHLAGGNPRLYIILSRLITPENLDQLVGPFEQMVDQQLTPYYQERMRWLSPQQQEIVQALCKASQPINVNMLAQSLFAGHSTITSQLKKLRELGYVLGHEKGRESRYELAEPLMRLSWQVKETSDSRPLSLLVDFLRIWYGRDELKKQLGRLATADRAHAYLEEALNLMQDGMPNLRHEIWRSQTKTLNHLDDDGLDSLIELANESNDFEDNLRAWACCVKARPEQSNQIARRILTGANLDSTSTEQLHPLITIGSYWLGDKPFHGLIGIESESAFNLLSVALRNVQHEGADLKWTDLSQTMFDAMIDGLMSKSPAIQSTLIPQLFESFKARNLLSDLSATVVWSLRRFVMQKRDWAELDRWQKTWFANWTEPSVAKPMMAAAVEYLKSNDESVFLELHQESRNLLREALALPPI